MIHSATVRVLVQPQNDIPVISVPPYEKQGGYLLAREGEAVAIVGAYAKGIGKSTVLTDTSKGFELWRSEGAQPGFGTDSVPTLMADQQWGEGDMAWRHGMVKDVFAGPQGSSPRHFAVYKDLLYFQSNDGNHGPELWRTDGSEAGTAIVKDIFPGSRGSSPRYLTTFNDELYFQADGVDTTWMLHNPENHMGRYYHPNDVDECNGFRQSSINTDVFFAVSESSTWDQDRAYDCPAGFHWASTAEATALFPDTHGSGTGGDGSGEMTYFSQCGWDEFDWGGSLPSVRRERFRFADSKLTGAYKHAGRAESYMPEISHDASNFAGVVCVKGEGECRGTAQEWGRGPEHSGVQATIADRESCFLRAGAELWKSDGTEHGTRRVTDRIRPGLAGSSPTYLTSMHVEHVDATYATPVNSTYLFFAAKSEPHGNELWRTDGTEAGTVMIEDIRHGDVSSEPQYLTVFGDKLYFSADGGNFGTELWVSDGIARSDFVGGLPGDQSVEGTKMVKDVNPHGHSSPRFLVVGVAMAMDGSDYLFFQAYTADAGAELWRSDGTEYGTQQVTDINSGGASSNPSYIVSYNGKIYFQADDGVNGVELWESDGLGAGTAMLFDVQPGTGSSYPSFLTVFKPKTGGSAFADSDVEKIFFVAAAADGTQMWVTDGQNTSRAYEQTRLPIAIDTVATNSDYPAQLAVYSDTLYFSASHPPSTAAAGVAGQTTATATASVPPPTPMRTSGPSWSRTWTMRPAPTPNNQQHRAGTTSSSPPRRACSPWPASLASRSRGARATWTRSSCSAVWTFPI